MGDRGYEESEAGTKGVGMCQSFGTLPLLGEEKSGSCFERMFSGHLLLFFPHSPHPCLLSLISLFP